jgi:hypothetical protein
MRIKTAQAARFPFLWINTTEEERVIRAHRRELKPEIKIFSWDIAQGFQALCRNDASTPNGYTWTKLAAADSDDDRRAQVTRLRAENIEPQEQIIDSPAAALDTIATMNAEAVFYLKDFHKFFSDITIIRRALNLKETLKATGRLVAFISAEGPAAIPLELKNDVTPFSFDMPTKAELAETIIRIAEDNDITAPTPEELDNLAASLIGLTEEAAESALSLCLVEQKRFDYATLLKQKARLIEGTAGLTFGEYQETFDDLAGLDVLKDYLKAIAGKPMARGILLYGIPGTGKSHTAKALGNYLQRATLTANLAGTRDKFQGNSEAKLDTMLSTIEAFGPSVVFSDEIDKALAGTQGGADSDGGTGARQVGRLLTYFQDRPDGGAFWIMTCNSLKDILTISGGAFVRRFDAMFFLDMPTARERAQIAEIWNKKMQVEIPADFDTDGMTGADIAKLARTMKMMDTDAETARRYVIPTRQALGATIDEIRRQAAATCINASRADERTTTTTGRRLNMKGGT